LPCAAPVWNVQLDNLKAVLLKNIAILNIHQDHFDSFSRLSLMYCNETLGRSLMELIRVAIAPMAIIGHQGVVRHAHQGNYF
jgi:hypothetical protein